MAEDSPTPETGEDDKSVPGAASPTVPAVISTVESAHKTVELFTKTFVVIAAVFYVTGFLVVSLHLARYGVHSFSILRAQYILTGAWFFAHIFFFVPITMVLWNLTYGAIEKYIKTKSILIKKAKCGDKERWLYWAEVGTLLLIQLVTWRQLYKLGISIFRVDEISSGSSPK